MSSFAFSVGGLQAIFGSIPPLLKGARGDPNKICDLLILHNQKKILAYVSSSNTSLGWVRVCFMPLPHLNLGFRFLSAKNKECYRSTLHPVCKLSMVIRNVWNLKWRVALVVSLAGDHSRAFWMPNFDTNQKSKVSRK